MQSSFQSIDKANRFRDLVESAQQCDLCPRLCTQRKVLSPANGSIESKVLFVAEAPGRLGADRTGVPLHGDRTGDNFEVLLGNIGWKREDIFITNAILCNPKQENGNNGTPTREEIANCSAYLEMVINLINPQIIVTLGVTALAALDLLTPHGIELREAVANKVPWRKTALFPLYHPGPRALIHRSKSKQRSDFMLLSKAVHPVKGLIQHVRPKRKTHIHTEVGETPLQQVIRAFLELGNKMTYFKLTKLLYLFDLRCIEKLGQTFASDVYLRQVEGPWPPALNKVLISMQGHEVRRYIFNKVSIVAKGPAPRFTAQLDEAILQIISEVFLNYGALSNAAIKTAVYSTAPMRFILREENRGKQMVNKPVLYKNQTARGLP